MLLSGHTWYKLLFMYRDGALFLIVSQSRVQDLRVASAVVQYWGPSVNEIQGSDCILVLFFEYLSQKQNKA